MLRPTISNKGNDNLPAEDNIKPFSGGSLTLQPTPGFCVKSFKVNSNDEKFFINICQALEVPAPDEKSYAQLLEVIKSTNPGSYRVPMSLSAPHNTKDRAGNTVQVCDIAINPRFFDKIKNSQMFYNFFMQIVFGALSERYNILLEESIVLQKRTFIGNLLPHYIRWDKVERATAGSEQQLVRDIDENELMKLNVKNKEDQSSLDNSTKPIYKLRARVHDEVVTEVHAELFMPECISSAEFNVDIGEDRIYVESLKGGYVFDKFVDYRLQQKRAQAVFDKTSKILQIRIPVQN